MGQIRDLSKKIRDTKGIFHAKMGSIKDRNRMDLTKAKTNLDSIFKSRDIPLPTKIESRLWFFQWSCMDVRVEL